ncbi:MAG: hypothetical protein AB4426_15685 [Xenococcaceae cyanobacterium]
MDTIKVNCEDKATGNRQQGIGNRQQGTGGKGSGRFIFAPSRSLE